MDGNDDGATADRTDATTEPAAAPAVPVSVPRPIHTVREIRSTPDETEPTSSYERESFLMNSQELIVEDEFHRRMGPRLNSGTAGRPRNTQPTLPSNVPPGVQPAVLPVVSQATAKPAPASARTKAANRVGGVMSSFWRTGNRDAGDRASNDSSVSSVSQGSAKANANANARHHSGSVRNTSSHKLPSAGIPARSKSSPANDPNHRLHPQQYYITQSASASALPSTVSRSSSTSSHTTNPMSNYSAYHADSSTSSHTPTFANMQRPRAERKVSGGLLGAALQLQSQSSSSSGGPSVLSPAPVARSLPQQQNQNVASPRHGAKNVVIVNPSTTVPASATGSRVQYVSEQATQHSDRLRRSGSSMSSHASTGLVTNTATAQRSNKKDITRQRQQARRQKMEALSGTDIVDDEDIQSVRSARSMQSTPVIVIPTASAVTTGTPVPGTGLVLASVQQLQTQTPMIATTAVGTRVVAPQAVIVDAASVSNDSLSGFRSVAVPPAAAETPLDTARSTASAEPMPMGSTATKVVAAYKTSTSLGQTGVGSFNTPSNVPVGAGMPSSASSVGTGAKGGTTAGSVSSNPSTLSRPINNGVVYPNSSSLLFPTGVASTNAATNVHGRTAITSAASVSSASASASIRQPAASVSAKSVELASKKQRKINMIIDQCESRFSFKKKLILEKMGLFESDIPVKDLYHTNLGNTLHKLSLAGNRIMSLPAKLVTCLPVLKTLDLSQCELHTLPEKWHLPQLKRLYLSNNQLTEFPDESILEGLLELNELNLYKNKISEISIPSNPKVLQKLEKLNLSFNDLQHLPDELDRLKALRYLKVSSNLLSVIPMRVCDMELKSIEVAGNPLMIPPLDTCERGICHMKRYYRCIRVEEQSKKKAFEAVQYKAGRAKKGSAVSASSITGSNSHMPPSSSKKPASSNSSVGGGSVTGSSGTAASVMSMFSQPMRKVTRLTSDDSHSFAPLAREGTSLGGRQRSTSSRSDDSAAPGHRRVPSYDGRLSAVRSTSVGTAYSVASVTDSSQGNRGTKTKPVPSSLPPPSSSSGMVRTLMPSSHKQQQQHDTDILQPLQPMDTAAPPRPSSTSMVPPPSPPPVGTPGTPSSIANKSLGSRSSKYQSSPSGKTQSPSQHSPESAVADVVDRAQHRPDVDKSVSYDSTGADEESEGENITINDTLKVIFVGMAMAGKTSMIRRLIQGEHAIVPKRDDRTIGVDIYRWDPKDDRRFDHIDSRIVLQDEELQNAVEDQNVKLSVWDFAGQHVYHATHELFFSKRALYVIVWDMGATNADTMRPKTLLGADSGAFKLTYDSSDDEDDAGAFISNEDERRADRALERDIDEKVQFWVDCIQSSAPGSAILPVASFDDLFSDNDGEEAKRRCIVMRDRLLRHEERRIQGIEQRLKEYEEQNRANETAAIRLRKLLCEYSRPKLIFGTDDDNSVVRVSGVRYTGFAELTERIIHIATGRDKVNMKFPIFRGHVGARIPRMRLQVRDEVRQMRNRYKVVEWGYFVNRLKDKGLTNVDDISDALHFLTNVGELSFFGGVMANASSSRTSAARSSSAKENKACKRSFGDSEAELAMSDDDDDEGYDEEDDEFVSVDDTSMTAASTTEAGSVSTSSTDAREGLSQFIFLNPVWLVAAVACILRHDLTTQIQEARRLQSKNGKETSSLPSFSDANLNCPVITSDDANMLWQSQKFAKKAAERAEEYSNNMTIRPFDFLQLLLMRFGVFVPIDLGIDKAFLGGKEYARPIGVGDEVIVGDSELEPETGKFFFLPSLLGPGDASESWTYKNTDSWKGTLCHTVLFPDGVPPGLMERIMASVLNTVHTATHTDRKIEFKAIDGSTVSPTPDGRISVKEILCWRNTFFLKLGMEVASDDETRRESVIEIFAGLVDRDSSLCVGSDNMIIGSRRLVLSGKGQIGDGGRKIWKGGYLWTCKAVQRVMEHYGGLEYEKEIFCPECLAKKAVSEASCWNVPTLKAAVKNLQGYMMCKHGHRVDTRLLAGPLDSLQPKRNREMQGMARLAGESSDAVVPINDMLPAVVVVGLWDGKTRKIVRVGSGFMADRKRGLIVTAAHTLMNIWGDKSTPFGENYYGLSQGKVVIGVIPRAREGEPVATSAMFRYFAKIVAKDPSIASGTCHLDACVLQITTRMENDVGGNGEGCGDQIERVLLGNPYALKQEKLQQLKITEKCELDEQVRIVGYNQGGEGLLGPGEALNRDVDFARGYVCMRFSSKEGSSRHLFQPREEIVIICPTIGGHSGGPCVNQQGEVIGILSRADPAETQRCYLVPTSEWKGLLKRAKKGM